MASNHRTFAYTRALTVPTGAEAQYWPALAVQEHTLVAYARREKLPLLVQPCYQDDPGSGLLRFQGRPAGAALLDYPRAGDHVIVTHLHVAFQGWPDAAYAIGKWSGRGVTFHATEVLGGFRSDSEEGAHVLQGLALFGALETFGAMETRTEQQATKEPPIRTLDTAQQPPPGFRWELRRGKRRVVVNHYERVVVWELWKLHLAGWGASRIARHLATASALCRGNQPPLLFGPDELEAGHTLASQLGFRLLVGLKWRGQTFVPWRVQRLINTIRIYQEANLAPFTTMPKKPI